MISETRQFGDDWRPKESRQGMRKIGRLLTAAAKDWVADKAPRIAAALSYYTIFSLPPLLVVLVAVAGWVFGAENVRTRLLAEIAELVGEQAAALLGEAIERAGQPGQGAALVLGVGALLFAAGGAFGQLQEALNSMLEVETPPGRGLWRMVRRRLLSIAAVAGAGFLLLVSLTVSAAIAAIVEVASGVEAMAPFLVLVDWVTSLVITTTVFAFLFRYLPDTRLPWRGVWAGAGLTAVLFVAGKFAIGFYLGTSEVGSAYGAASALITVLVWVYYSALILFYGAEVAHQVATTTPKTLASISPPGRASSENDQWQPSRLVATLLFVVVWWWDRKRGPD